MFYTTLMLLQLTVHKLRLIVLSLLIRIRVRVSDGMIVNIYVRHACPVSLSSYVHSLVVAKVVPRLGCDGFESHCWLCCLRFFLNFL